MQAGADPASVSQSHRTWGTCTIFPQCTSLLLFKLVHASCSVSSIKRSKLGSRLVSANLVAPACWAKRWLAMAPGKSVLACGRTLLVWKWLPVATLPHFHTTTLPHYHTATLLLHCQGRPRWGRPPRSVLGSRQLLLTLGLQQGAPGRRPRRWNLELLLSAKVALFPLIIAEWTKWQGLMWALETLGRSTSRHHQHNNPLLSSFHV